MSTHREEQETHAKMRAFQRFGCNLTDREFHRLVKFVEKRRGIFIAKKSQNHSVWAVVLPNGKVAHAVYDLETRMIATFFPPAWGAGSTEGRQPPMHWSRHHLPPTG